MYVHVHTCTCKIFDLPLQLCNIIFPTTLEHLFSIFRVFYYTQAYLFTNQVAFMQNILVL